MFERANPYRFLELFKVFVRLCFLGLVHIGRHGGQRREDWAIARSAVGGHRRRFEEGSWVR